MDFIKGNEQVRIDPSGIDISGAGHIVIDSNSITGDIDFNDKVNINSDVSMNAKVTISDNLNVIGDLSMNGIIDMCGNVRFDDVTVSRSSTDTWFGDNLRGGENINGGGWYLVRQAFGNVFNGDFNLEFNINRNTFVDDIYSLSNFDRITPIANYDEILIYSHLDNKWWVIDYNVFKLQKDVQYTSQTMAGITNAIKYSYSSISAQALAIFRSGANYFSLGITEWIGLGYSYGSADKLFYRSSIDAPTGLTRFYSGISVFVRNSTNIPTNPTPYPTVIKKELDHLHISAPLNIYPEGDYELDDLGLSGNFDLKFDGNNSTDPNVTVDASGGWYLVRQANAVASSLYNQPSFYMDNFHFGISYGTKQAGDTYPSGHFWARNVSNYDYDEVLFHMIDPNNSTKILWQIWDRTSLESLMSRYNSSSVQISGVKKSSLSSNPHTVKAAVRPNYNHHDPQIHYSYPGANLTLGEREWEAYEGRASHRSYYVRRSDGQPVRLKNRVKVDVDGNLGVDGNLDVDGKITCSQISALNNNGGNNLTFTSDGYVGIGTTNPDAPLHVVGDNKSYDGGSWRYISDVDTDPGYSHNAGPNYSLDVAIKSSASIWIYGSGNKSYFATSSDNRIKTEIEFVNDDEALNMINNLETVKYHYRDPAKKNNIKTIGFLAQDVKEVIPNAVALQTAYIPDEMRIITEPIWNQNTNNNWLLDIPDLDMSGNFTGKAKFYVSNDLSGNDEECKEVDIKEVSSQSLLFPSTTKFVAEFDQSWNNIFFYGKEVSDFHTLDKNQIFALHHSAIQELSRRNEKLQEDNDTKTSKIASLESRVEALEEAILAMQSLIQGLQ